MCDIIYVTLNCVNVVVLLLLKACDGLGLTFPFGKRHVETRDINVHCCNQDLCNYPEQITTTATTGIGMLFSFTLFKHRTIIMLNTCCALSETQSHSSSPNLHYLLTKFSYDLDVMFI